MKAERWPLVKGGGGVSGGQTRHPSLSICKAQREIWLHPGTMALPFLGLCLVILREFLHQLFCSLSSSSVQKALCSPAILVRWENFDLRGDAGRKPPYNQMSFNFS